MNMLRNFFKSPSLHNLLFVILLVSITSGLGYLANRYHLQYDSTFNTSNSLDKSSIDVLKQMNKPIDITVFSANEDVQSGDLRQIIRNFLSLYQRYKEDINLTFIDPTEETEKARAAGIRRNGEMIIEYDGRREHLKQINEQILTSALLRLAHQKNQIIMYLDGHGERKLDGIANFDLGSPFGEKIKKNGFKISPLNLAIAQEAPTNISVLVITHPQVDLLPGEIEKLLAFIDRGGNLLWLIDAEPLHGLEQLAERLNLLLPPGIVIDPNASEMNAPATWALGTNYAAHSINRDFDLITAFPKARPIIVSETETWQHQTLLEVAQRGWVSPNTDTTNLKFNKETDIAGPITIAASLQRDLNDKEQRIVVVGNGAFLSNSFAGNGGNIDWGINMINWLSGEEHLISIQPRASKDSSLTLSKNQLLMISAGFFVFLPLLLAAAGILLWWKRRRN